MQDYEDGMIVFFDTVTKSVFINFRGELDYIFGPFTSRSEAIAAGESRCRQLGWQSNEKLADHNLADQRKAA